MLLLFVFVEIVSSENFRDEPGVLLEVNNETGVVDINKNAIDFIKNLQMPVHVVTAAGAYRVGKSFLLGKLVKKQINKSMQGFGVSAQPRTFTRGAWMQVTAKENYELMWLDLEGLFSGEAAQDGYGDKLFSFSLLSSSLILLVNTEKLTSELVDYFKVQDQNLASIRQNLSRAVTIARAGAQFLRTPFIVWTLNKVRPGALGGGMQIFMDFVEERRVAKSNPRVEEDNRMRRKLRTDYESTVHELSMAIDNVHLESLLGTPEEPPLRDQFLRQMQELEDTIHAQLNKREPLSAKSLAKKMQVFLEVTKGEQIFDERYQQLWIEQHSDELCQLYQQNRSNEAYPMGEQAIQEHHLRMQTWVSEEMKNRREIDGMLASGLEEKVIGCLNNAKLTIERKNEKALADQALTRLKGQEQECVGARRLCLVQPCIKNVSMQLELSYGVELVQKVWNQDVLLSEMDKFRQVAIAKGQCLMPLDMMLMHVSVKFAWAMLPWIHAPSAICWWLPYLIWPYILQGVFNNPVTVMMVDYEQFSPVIRTIRGYASRVDDCVIACLFLLENSFPQAASGLLNWAPAILEIISFLVCVAGLCFSKFSMRPSRIDTTMQTTIWTMPDFDTSNCSSWKGTLELVHKLELHLDNSRPLKMSESEGIEHSVVTRIASAQSCYGEAAQKSRQGNHDGYLRAMTKCLHHAYCHHLHQVDFLKEKEKFLSLWKCFSKPEVFDNLSHNQKYDEPNIEFMRTFQSAEKESDKYAEAMLKTLAKRHVWKHSLPCVDQNDFMWPVLDQLQDGRRIPAVIGRALKQVSEHTKKKEWAILLDGTLADSFR